MKVVFINFGPYEKPLRHIRARYDEENAISPICAITGHSKPRVPTRKRSFVGSLQPLQILHKRVSVASCKPLDGDYFLHVEWRLWIDTYSTVENGKMEAAYRNLRSCQQHCLTGELHQEIAYVCSVWGGVLAKRHRFHSFVRFDSRGRKAQPNSSPQLFPGRTHEG